MRPRDHAADAAEALRKLFRVPRKDYDAETVAGVIEKAITKAILERRDTEHQAEIQAAEQNAAYARLCTLVASSPAIIYSYEAKGSFPADLRWGEYQKVAGL